MIDLKAVTAAMFVSTGTVLAAVGLSAGIASAAPAAPAIAGPQYISENGPDRGHGHGHGHDDDWWWRENGPRQWDPIDACIGVEGPFGYVQGGACI
ncbi:hypothetical protein [Mycolicibacterium stellerae]|uniref:hypothetical protein n=1 Tax=Mycolicibacterium stellerae TaxID=2358193 RepID=UPI0013DE55FB|nr:hypothetical protein [Mycolicibacterium stellerae]